MSGLTVHLVLGFLGAGKTTLLARLLGHLAGRERVALVVNEFGEAGVDGALLGDRAVDMVELAAGCICCTLKGPLDDAIAGFAARGDVDRVFVEASGVAQAGDLVAALGTLAAAGEIALAPVVAVVDGARFIRLKAMLGPFYADQVARADVILVNRTDRADAATLAAAAAEIAAVNATARLAFTERCEVDMDELLAGAAQARPAATGAHFHAAAETVALAAPAAARRDGVEAFFAALPDQVWRAKGFMTIDGEVRLVQYVPGALDIVAAARPPHTLMVFVGREIDRAGLARRFAALGDAPAHH